MRRLEQGELTSRHRPTPPSPFPLLNKTKRFQLKHRKRTSDQCSCVWLPSCNDFTLGLSSEPASSTLASSRKQRKVWLCISARSRSASSQRRGLHLLPAQRCSRPDSPSSGRPAPVFLWASAAPPVNDHIYVTELNASSLVMSQSGSYPMGGDEVGVQNLLHEVRLNFALFSEEVAPGLQLSAERFELQMERVDGQVWVGPTALQLQRSSWSLCSSTSFSEKSLICSHRGALTRLRGFCRSHIRTWSLKTSKHSCFQTFAVLPEKLDQIKNSIKYLFTFLLLS